MKKTLAVLLCVFCAGAFLVCAKGVSVPMISKDDLKAMLDKPDIAILDLRSAADWDKSDMKIKGAMREDPMNVDSWAGKFAKDKQIIMYCADGKSSPDAAKKLMEMGYTKVSILKGGWPEWETAKYPMEKKEAAMGSMEEKKPGAAKEESMKEKLMKKGKTEARGMMEKKMK